MRDTDEALVNKYKVKSFPTFFLLKNNEKPIKYDGDTYTYSQLFEFVNIYSETFVFGGTKDKEVKSAAAKPWLNSSVPYLASDSANDICLKKDGTLCVVYIVKDKNSSDQAVLDALQNVKNAFVSKIERGITFSFIRLDASAEPEFFSMFNLETSDLPAVVILNPGKRKRFLLHENGLSEDAITETLDKILGGDARFKAIPQLAELKTPFEQYV